MLTMQTSNVELRKAVADAVHLVNNHSGQAAVRLVFDSVDIPALDFVANSATFQGDSFVFTSGFETFDGTLGELKDIRAEVIRH